MKGDEVVEAIKRSANLNLFLRIERNRHFDIGKLLEL